MARKAKTTQTTTPPAIDRLAIASNILDVAVPLYIAQLRALRAEEFQATWQSWIDDSALEAAGVFSEVLPAGGGKPGDAARAFTGLAKALAAMSFVPGGVPFGTRRYEANPADELEESNQP